MTTGLRLAKLLAFAVLANFASAQELRLPDLLSDHAVLQANVPIVISGWAAPETHVKVTLGAQSEQAEVDKNGTFFVEFPARPPSFEPLQLSVSTPERTLIRDDILIGDVWLAGGQSNMVWELEDAVGGRAESVTANDPYLRVFEVAESAQLAPQEDVSGHWIRVRPRAARRFSAVGYYFGKRLRQQTDIPIGIVQVAYGGTRIEAWMPADEMAASDVFETARQQFETARQEIEQERREWLNTVGTDIRQFAADSEMTSRLEHYNPPVWPGSDMAKNTPTVLYNAMLGPVLNFPNRGMIWYQGESNRDDGLAYADKLKAFISVLRGSQHDAYPVGIVQIAPVAREPGFQDIWQAQLEVTQGDENAGLIVTTDLAELLDIHPRRKREVGERLANWALHRVYRRSSVSHSGPLIRTVQAHSDRIVLTFDYTDDLKTLDGGPLSGFVLRDETGRRQFAEAVIDERAVVLKVDPLFNACTVEYHMRPDAFPTLTNASGLPASPFSRRVQNCNVD